MNEISRAEDEDVEKPSKWNPMEEEYRENENFRKLNNKPRAYHV